MQRYSRFLAAVRSGLSRLENGRLGLRCVSFAELCYFTKNFYRCRKNFFSPFKIQKFVQCCEVFRVLLGNAGHRGRGTQGSQVLARTLERL